MVNGRWTVTWDQADPAMADVPLALAEEVEHRCVAYDLFEHHKQVWVLCVAPSDYGGGFLFIYFLADFARSLGKQDLEHGDIQN